MRLSTSAASTHLAWPQDYVDAQDSNLKDYTDEQIADLQGQIDSTGGDYLTKQGQQDLASDTWRVRQPNADGNNRSFITILNGVLNLYHVLTSNRSDDNWADIKNELSRQALKATGTVTG